MESGHRTAGVNALSSLAYMLAGSRDGVLVAEAAARVGGVPATMVALAGERLAWARARVGDADGTLRALDAVDAAWDRRVSGDEPDATYWLSASEIEIMRGRCYVELRRPLRAVPLLERVLSSYEWSTRESALYLSYLADAYEQANEPGAAAETMKRARDLASRVHSARITERLGK